MSTAGTAGTGKAEPARAGDEAREPLDEQADAQRAGAQTADAQTADAQTASASTFKPMDAASGSATATAATTMAATTAAASSTHQDSLASVDSAASAASASAGASVSASASASASVGVRRHHSLSQPHDRRTLHWSPSTQSSPGSTPHAATTNMNTSTTGMSTTGTSTTNMNMAPSTVVSMDGSLATAPSLGSLPSLAGSSAMHPYDDPTTASAAAFHADRVGSFRAFPPALRSGSLVGVAAHLRPPQAPQASRGSSPYVPILQQMHMQQQQQQLLLLQQQQQQQQIHFNQQQQILHNNNNQQQQHFLGGDPGQTTASTGNLATTGYASDSDQHSAGLHNPLSHQHSVSIGSSRHSATARRQTSTSPAVMLGSSSTTNAASGAAFYPSSTNINMSPTAYAYGNGNGVAFILPRPPPSPGAQQSSSTSIDSMDFEVFSGHDQERQPLLMDLSAAAAAVTTTPSFGTIPPTTLSSSNVLPPATAAYTPMSAAPIATDAAAAAAYASARRLSHDGSGRFDAPRRKPTQERISATSVSADQYGNLLSQSMPAGYMSQIFSEPNGTPVAISGASHTNTTTTTSGTTGITNPFIDTNGQQGFHENSIDYLDHRDSERSDGHLSPSHYAYPVDNFEEPADTLDYDRLAAAFEMAPSPRSKSRYGINRFMFYSETTGVLRNTTFSSIDLTNYGQPVKDLLKSGPFWLDVCDPTRQEMMSISRAFNIHPLTDEDIQTPDTREKCEVFKNYYFVVIRTFEQDQSSPDFMQPITVFIVIFRECIVSFQFRPNPHANNVLARIDQLRAYGLHVTSDWINYALIDDITDGFLPPIKFIDLEVEIIDDLVLILKESEQSDMLRRIGHARKRVMQLLRLLNTKADVVKLVISRCMERLAPDSETRLYLEDIQDHVLTMTQNLSHYEKTLARSHSNYLAQISIEITQASNRTSDVVMRMTALASILVPLNVVTGLWGMNVHVPGQDDEGLRWFFIILSGMGLIAAVTFYAVRRANLV